MLKESHQVHEYLSLLPSMRQLTFIFTSLYQNLPKAKLPPAESPTKIIRSGKISNIIINTSFMNIHQMFP